MHAHKTEALRNKVWGNSSTGSTSGEVALQLIRLWLIRVCGWLLDAGGLLLQVPQAPAGHKGSEQAASASSWIGRVVNPFRTNQAQTTRLMGPKSSKPYYTAEELWMPPTLLKHFWGGSRRFHSPQETRVPAPASEAGQPHALY